MTLMLQRSNQMQPTCIGRWRHRRGANRGRAQALVEFALVVPLFLILLMVSVQVSILFTAHLTTIWLGQEIVRYVATGSPERWRFADTCHVAFWNARFPAFLIPANFTQFVISPSYGPPTANCGSVAGNVPATTRVRGTAISVTLQYNPTNLIVLPVNFFGATFPTTLPPYRVSAVME